MVPQKIHKKKSGEEKAMKSNQKNEKKDYTNTIIAVLVGVVVIVVLGYVFYTQYNPSAPEKTQVTNSQVVAVVNGQEVTMAQLDKEYTYLDAQTKALVDKNQFLKDSLVPKILLLQEGSKEKITEAEIDTVMDAYAQQLGVTRQELLDQLKQRGIPVEALREQLKISLLLNKTVASQVTVDENEIASFYEKNKDQFQMPEQVRASHILVCYKEALHCPNNRTKEEAKALAENIKKQLDDGKDFAELAKEYSSDSTKEQGGDLGYFTKGQMVKQFEDAAFALDEGKHSGVVETEFGFHIIKLTGKKPAGVVAMQDVAPQIKNNILIQKQQAAVRLYVNALVQKSTITYTQTEETQGTEVNAQGPQEAGTAVGTKVFVKGGIYTFEDKGNEICRDEKGLPIVRVYSTTVCPHCNWIHNTVDKVLKEYADAGKIAVNHWELDSKDDTLTSNVESDVPAEAIQFYQKYNQEGSVPTFVFGCKYVRIGNGYERDKDLAKEEAEFRAVIDSLVNA